MGRPLAPRVEALEQKLAVVDELAERQARLEKVAAQLRRDQRDTRKHLRDLTERVDLIVPGVHQKLDEQTAAINQHVDERNDALQSFVLAQVVESARQWPAPAIVAVTAVLALVVAIGGDLLLAAAHLPHLS